MPADITLTLRHDAGVFRLAGLPGEGALLIDDDVWERVIERATRLSRTTPLRLTLAIPPPNVISASDATNAVRNHFARRREIAEYQLHRTLRTGWVTLAMATVFLVVVIALGEAVRRTVPPNWLSAVAVEGLMIVGWVAMWRPVDLLLYEPRIHRREIALLRRLEEMDVRVVEQSSDLNVRDSLHRPGNTHQ